MQMPRNIFLNENQKPNGRFHLLFGFITIGIYLAYSAAEENYINGVVMLVICGMTWLLCVKRSIWLPLILAALYILFAYGRIKANLMPDYMLTHFLYVFFIIFSGAGGALLLDNSENVG